MLVVYADRQLEFKICRVTPWLANVQLCGPVYILV